MKKIFLLSLIVIGLFFAGQAVFADTANLSVLPSSATKNVGSVFNVAVKIDPAENKVCIIKGTLVFDNLSCQSITLTSGIMAQTVPTCASPNFTIGIPKCATALQDVMQVSFKGIKAGAGTLAFTGVNMVGAGTPVASSSNGGSYNITAIPAPTVQPTQPEEQQPVKEQTPAPITENVIPKEAGVAGLSTVAGNLFKSPVAIIIVIVIILILIGLWAFDKFYKSKKEIK